MTRNPEIAQTILAQLGGGRLAVMTGAHAFVALDSGLQFSLKPGSKDRVRKVRVVLTPMDAMSSPSTRGRQTPSSLSQSSLK